MIRVPARLTRLPKVCFDQMSSDQTEHWQTLAVLVFHLVRTMHQSPWDRDSIRDYEDLCRGTLRALGLDPGALPEILYGIKRD